MTEDFFVDYAFGYFTCAWSLVVLFAYGYFGGLRLQRLRLRHLCLSEGASSSARALVLELLRVAKLPSCLSFLSWRLEMKRTWP